MDSNHINFSNHLLYSLFGFLCRAELQEQVLQIQVKPTPLISPGNVGTEIRMVYPISRMPPHAKIHYEGVSKMAIENIRTKWLDGCGHVHPDRRVQTRFGSPEAFKDVAPRVEAELGAWKEEIRKMSRSSRIVAFRWRGFIRMVLGKVGGEMRRSFYGLRDSDKKIAASTKTLVRWLEWREAGLSFGDEVRSCWHAEWRVGDGR